MNAKGNGPPANLDPSDLWSQITTLPRAHRVVPFPRNNRDGLPVGMVALVVLEGDEINASNINAEKHAREQYKKIVGQYPKSDETSIAYEEIFKSRASREILFRSCKSAHECEPDDRGVCLVDHEKFKPFFPTQEAIGKLTIDEQSILMNHYARTQVEVGPIASLMSKQEMDAWLEKLGASGDASPLASFSLVLLIDLLMHSAFRLYGSQTGSD